MDRYSSFDGFMRDVVRVANETCNLNELFKLKSDEILEIIMKILFKGWNLFIAVATLLALSTPIFGVTMMSFLSTPLGVVFLAVFGFFAIDTLKKLYQDRKLPLAIKDVGTQYKPLYRKMQENTEVGDERNDKIDGLLKEATIALIEKAKCLSKQEREDLEVVLNEAFLQHVESSIRKRFWFS